MAKKSTVARSNRPRSLLRGSFVVASVAAASVPLCATSVCAAFASARQQTRALSLVFANHLGNCMVTDPIADFLIRLQNASKVNKESVSMPYSQMKFSIAEVLAKAGYIGEISKKKVSTAAKRSQSSLFIQKRQARDPGAKRISKPSRRMYMSVHDIKPVKRGYGLLVLSTPAGILSGKEAKREACRRRSPVRNLVKNMSRLAKQPIAFLPRPKCLWLTAMYR
jgi:small subunit ribosomal protein S8